jgi:hypothetical protein
MRFIKYETYSRLNKLPSTTTSSFTRKSGAHALAKYRRSENKYKKYIKFVDETSKFATKIKNRSEINISYN